MSNIFFDFDEEWDDTKFLEEVVQIEAQLRLTSTAPKPPSDTHALPLQPPPSTLHSHIQHDVVSFSPPRELSQRPTTSFSVYSPSLTPNPHSDKDLQIERLKRELEQATKQIENLEQEHAELKRERDKKEDQSRFISSRNEEENACAKCSKSKSTNKLANNKVYNLAFQYIAFAALYVVAYIWPNDREFETLAPNCLKVSSKIQKGISSNDPMIVETSCKGFETDKVNHQQPKSVPSDDLPAYLDLSQKLLAIWGSPTDKKMGNNAISKLLVGCQRDFHILFGCMNMGLPSEITRELLSDLSSSGVALHHLKDRFHSPEAAKMSNLYLALTKIADGTTVLETLIEPLLDICGMENVVIVHSSVRVLHMLLKLLLELENNVGRRDNIFIEGLCVGKDLVDSGVKDGNLFNGEIVSRTECSNYQNSLQPHVNWIYLFEIMHQIAMRITEERVRVEAVSIMKLLFLRSNAFFEREQFSEKIVFKTISELLKKDAGLSVKKHALRLLYLVINCPKLLAAFCCGCKEGDDSNAMDDDDNDLASDIQNFKIILQGLSDCMSSHRGGLLELKVSRNAILVLAFLSSSGQPGFEIFVGHRFSNRGVNYLMLILQLLVSEIDHEAGSYEQQPEIFRERTFLIREILILLNRLVSSPSYSATVLHDLTATRDMAGLTIDVASRLSRKGKKNEEQDSMKHIRETEIVDLARLFKKRVFTYLGDDLY
ncbi:hypothetical protein VNO78_08755 [Psophocarpus tetragonolobus]|uniref:Uncharacterized protein n=1 Tax=Psophocarpus tetragonolobus TaxID=3891 RepID=A0AAN9T6H7_PSOTE